MADIQGTVGADILNGTADADQIYGDDGNDTLNGLAGNDSLLGQNGDDILNGGADNDTLDGGIGADALNGGDGNDVIIAGLGDQVDGGLNTDTVTFNLRALTGGVNVNLASASTISFGSGSTMVGIEVGEILLGSGNDIVALGATTIIVRAGDGADVITGTVGNDTAYGEAGNDTMSGQDGNDMLDGGDGNNTLNGNDGIDTLISGNGTDTLTGGIGDDILNAGEGADTLNGGDGNDVITGGLGADTMTGGAGVDRYTFGFGVPRSESSPSTVDVVTDFEGAGIAGGDLIDLPGLSAGLPLVFSAASQTFVVGATGVQLPTEYVGDGLADVSWQYNAGQNRVEIWVDANDDGQLSEVDMVIYLNGVTSLIQSDFVDNFLVWRGTGGNDTYFGNALANTAYGILGDDTLNGAGGTDTLYGAQGNDTLNGDAGVDYLYGGLDNDTLNGGDDADNLYGQDGNDVINGGFGADTLSGGLGDDVLNGGADNDTLEDNWFQTGGGNNQFFGNDGNDDLRVYNAVTGAVNTLDGGAGIDNLVLNGGSGSMMGGTGNDTLQGYQGTYSMDGGADNDLLYMGLQAYNSDDGVQTATGGTGADRFVLHGASNGTEVDRITDFNAAEGDLIQITGVGNGRQQGSFPVNNISLLFRGAMDPALFVNGAALPGTDIGTGFAQYWTVQTGGNTYLVGDTDGDLIFDETDFVLRCDGLVTINTASFVAGTFVAQAGTTGVDTMVGTAGDDQLYAIAGNDSIDGLDGNDALYGGAGDDVINGGAGGDTIFAGDGVDSVNGGTEADTVHGEAGADTLNGDAGNDQLYGGADNDVINGGDDADNLYGQDGNDVINGGFGADTLSGGLGDDVLNGGADNDTLEDNWFQTGGGNNQFFGNDGNDDLRVYNAVTGAVNTLDGGAGIDNLVLNGGSGSMMGGTGNDTLQGYQGTYSMDGGADNDLFYMGLQAYNSDDGVQTATGGTGADRFVLHGASNGTEVDRITDFNAAEGDLIQITGVGNGRQQGSFPVNNISLLFRGAMDPALFVNGAALPGTDIGTGFAQYWTVQTGGNTYLVGDTDGDLIFDETDFVLRFDGLVTINTASFVAGTFVAQAGTTGVDTMVGTAGDDQLYAIAGNDSIDGLDGNDALYGGAGDDVINGGAGGDTIFAGDGVDSVNGGTEADTVHGEAGADTLNGDAGNDQLYGGADNDVINGGDDADNLYGQDGNDVINGGFGADTLSGGLGDDVLNGGADNDTLEDNWFQTGGGNNQFFGNDGNDDLRVYNAVTGAVNTLDGGAGIDNLVLNGGSGSMMGGTGNDTLQGYQGTYSMDGGADNDLFYMGLQAYNSDDGVQTATGGTGADRFVLHGASNGTEVDRITDFNAAEGDLIQITGVGNGRQQGSFPVNNISLLFRGAMDPALFVNGAALPGTDIGTGFAQYWTVQTGGNTYLVGDTDGDLIFDETDFVLRFDGLVTINTASFVAGTFVAQAGTTGVDTMVGTAGDDQLYAIAGNDSIDGLDGNDALYGGAGDDVINGGAGGDTIFAGDGVDSVNGGTEADTVHGEAGADTLNGDAGNDQLYGGADNDVINGGDDADNLYGQDGNDVINGGFGADTLSGGLGDDVLNGGADNDTLEDNWFQTGGGNNQFFGNDGNDDLRVYNAVTGAVNTLDGGAGIDNLVLNGGSGSMMGGTGNDTLQGYQGTYSMDGGADNDLFYMGLQAYNSDDGVQTATGGTGADRFVLHGASNGTEVDRITDFNAAEGDLIQITGVGNGRQQGSFPVNNISLLFRGAMDPALFVNGAALPGTDIGTGFAQYWTVQTGGNTYLVGDTDGDLIFDETDFVLRFDGLVTINTASFVAGTFVNLAGTPNGDAITGTSAIETIYGVAGNDTLIGGQGIDTLFGGVGADRFLYTNLLDAPVGSELDTIADFEVGSDKVDLTPLGITAYTITSSGGYYILDAETASGSMRIRISANGVFSATDILGLPGTTGPINGTNGPNTLTGTIGDDVINGLGGNDTINGIDGNDVLNGDGGADTLNGGAGDDALDGGASNDTMLGGAGNDTYYVNLTTDVVTETAGNGIDTVFSTASTFTLSVNVENITLLGAAAINATANTLANIVTGNNGANNLAGLGGNDTIIGGAGNDRLIGGAGADVLIGGTGNDTYQIVDALDTITELVGEGIDLVQSSVNYTLGANLEKLYLSGGALIGIGNELANTIIGTTGANTLNGMAGADFIYGGNGNDVIIGGAGRDQLFGEAGADMFAFDDGDFGGVTSGTADLLRDFSLLDGDIIDLSAVDAITGGADDGFAFIGNAAFSNVAGQLRFQTSATSTTVMGDMNGDGIADFWIVLTGVHALDGADFVL